MIAFFFTVLILMATIGGLFTFFEICILRLFFKIENFKYVKLLKIRNNSVSLCFYYAEFSKNTYYFISFNIFYNSNL